ncbi:MAG: nucleotidyltransferase domain-containing protein [Solirubrobacterales bacterium]
MLGVNRGAESNYLAAVREQLRAVLDERVIGVYAGGSYALGDYLPGRSDLDIAVVVPDPLSQDRAEAAVSELRHESLPCPARRLELVVYLAETARSGSAAPDFELNLNSGASSPLSAQRSGDPGDVGGHWFAIDRSILSQAGVALFGPPAGEVFAPIPLEELTPVLIESLRWHREHTAEPSDAVLNACRALRFAEDELWASKPAAGRWAVEKNLAPEDLVAQALTARTHEAAIDAADVAVFLRGVESRLRQGFGGLGTL